MATKKTRVKKVNVPVQTIISVYEDKSHEVIVVCNRSVQTVISTFPLEHDDSIFLGLLEYIPFSEISQENEGVIDMPRKTRLTWADVSPRESKEITDQDYSPFPSTSGTDTMVVDKDVQTTIMVFPHVLENDVAATVVENISTQTSITALPEDSNSKIIPLLKKNLEHDNENNSSSNVRTVTFSNELLQQSPTSSGVAKTKKTGHKDKKPKGTNTTDDFDQLLQSHNLAEEKLLVFNDFEEDFATSSNQTLYSNDGQRYGDATASGSSSRGKEPGESNISNESEEQEVFNYDDNDKKEYMNENNQISLLDSYDNFSVPVELIEGDIRQLGFTFPNSNLTADNSSKNKIFKGETYNRNEKEMEVKNYQRNVSFANNDVINPNDSFISKRVNVRENNCENKIREILKLAGDSFENEILAVFEQFLTKDRVRAAIFRNLYTYKQLPDYSDKNPSVGCEDEEKMMEKFLKTLPIDTTFDDFQNSEKRCKCSKRKLTKKRPKSKNHCKIQKKSSRKKNKVQLSDAEPLKYNCSNKCLKQEQSCDFVKSECTINGSQNSDEVVMISQFPFYGKRNVQAEVCFLNPLGGRYSYGDVTVEVVPFQIIPQGFVYEYETDCSESYREGLDTSIKSVQTDPSELGEDDSEWTEEENCVGDMWQKFSLPSPGTYSLKADIMLPQKEESLKNVSNGSNGNIEEIPIGNDENKLTYDPNNGFYMEELFDVYPMEPEEENVCRPETEMHWEDIVLPQKYQIKSTKDNNSQMKESLKIFDYENYENPDLEMKKLQMPSCPPRDFHPILEKGYREDLTVNQTKKQNVQVNNQKSKSSIGKGFKMKFPTNFKRKNVENKTEKQDSSTNTSKHFFSKIFRSKKRVEAVVDCEKTGLPEINADDNCYEKIEEVCLIDGKKPTRKCSNSTCCHIRAKKVVKISPLKADKGCDSLMHCERKIEMSNKNSMSSSLEKLLVLSTSSMKGKGSEESSTIQEIPIENEELSSSQKIPVAAALNALEKEIVPLRAALNQLQRRIYLLDLQDVSSNNVTHSTELITQRNICTGRSMHSQNTNTAENEES